MRNKRKVTNTLGHRVARWRRRTMMAEVFFTTTIIQPEHIGHYVLVDKEGKRVDADYVKPDTELEDLLRDNALEALGITPGLLRGF